MAGVVYFNGFESGDASECSAALTAGFSIVSATKRTGGYALKAVNSTAGPQTELARPTAASAYYARAAVNIHKTATPGGTEQSNPFMFYTAAGSPIGYVVTEITSGGVLQFAGFWNAVAAEVYTPSSGAMVLDAWTVFEIAVTISATVGTVVVKVNGVTQISVTGKNTGTTNIGRFDVKGFNTSGVGDTYWDDICIRDDAMPGIGRVIARQGKAGTPNADAWTKTSSQTSAQVWSETPYSATNEAHATAASQAQTMLLADAGAGTHPIYSGDIINAIKTAIVAKEIGGAPLSATYYRRRRFGGSNTDTAIALTSSDAYYEGSIFTDTLANLQSAELGGVQGSEADGSAVAIVTAGAEGSAASGNVTPGAPASTATNDILICVVHSTDRVSHSMNASYWTQIAQFNGGSTTSRLSIWWGRIAAGETRDYLVSHSGGDSIISGVVAYRNCVTTGSPVHLAGTAGSGTDASMETTGQTTTVNNCMLVMVHGAGNDNNITVPSGWNARLEDSGGGTQNCFQTTLGTDGMVGVMDKLLATAGAQADVTVTQGASNAWASYMFSLVPVAYKRMQIEDGWVFVDYTPTLPADGGSYAQTGTAASVKASRKITADASSYSQTGTDATIRVIRKIVAASDTYSQSGTAASIKAARLLTAGGGTYSQTGTAATFANAPIVASAGSYSQVGTDATIRANRSLSAAAGTYSQTGGDASIRVVRAISAGLGAYSQSGTDAAIKATFKASEGAGSYSQAGTDASIRARRPIVASPGSYSYSGTDADFTVEAGGTETTLSVDGGSYAQTGTDASIRAIRAVAALGSSYSHVGASVQIRAALKLAADAGSHSQAGADAAVRARRLISADTGSHSSTGTDARILAALRILLSDGSYAYTGSDAAFDYMPFWPYTEGLCVHDLAVSADTVTGLALSADTVGPLSLSANTVSGLALSANTVTGLAISADTVTGFAMEDC